MNFLSGIVFTCFVGYVHAVVPFFLLIYFGSTALVSGHQKVTGSTLLPFTLHIHPCVVFSYQNAQIYTNFFSITVP